MGMGGGSAMSLSGGRLPSPVWIAVGVAAMTLGLAYWPNFMELGRVWRTDPSYSHGVLVIPIAILILRRRLMEIPRAESGAPRLSAWLGFIGLGIVLAARAVAYERNMQWAETVTMIPAIGCLVWALGGWPLLRQAWPAVAFLVFMMPLPAVFNDLIALPLQRIATTGSYFMLQLTGQWAVQEGNVITLETPNGPAPLDVALACNGLRMLMTLATTVTATILLIPMETWKQIVLLLSAVPIAMVSNIARIVATGWSYRFIQGHEAKLWAHDISGWLMMPLALVLVGLELWLLSWLAAESEEEERKILPVFAQKRF